MNPIVAIITPTKNRLKLLCEAMDSVQRQSFDAWEHIIVDDGSDDGTPAEVARRAAADSRIRYIRRTGDNVGANVCRNLGWRQSASVFVMFLDSDDILSRDCVSRRVDVMRRNPDLDFAVFDSDVFQGRLGDLSRRFDVGAAADDLDRFLALDPPWETTGPIWRRDILSNLGGWDDDLRSWQDIDLHIRALAAGPRYVRFRVVDHHIRWVVSEERISRRKAFEIELIENCVRCANRWREVLSHGCNLSPQRNRALSGVLFHLSEQLAGLGAFTAALTVWSSARDFGASSAVLSLGRLQLAAIGLPLGRSRMFLGLHRRWKAANGLIPPLPRREYARPAASSSSVG